MPGRRTRECKIAFTRKLLADIPLSQGGSAKLDDGGAGGNLSGKSDGSDRATPNHSSGGNTQGVQQNGEQKVAAPEVNDRFLVPPRRQHGIYDSGDFKGALRLSQIIIALGKHYGMDPGKMRFGLNDQGQLKLDFSLNAWRVMLRAINDPGVDQ